MGLLLLSLVMLGLLIGLINRGFRWLLMTIHKQKTIGSTDFISEMWNCYQLQGN